MSDLAGDAIDRYARDHFWQEVDRAYETMTTEHWRVYRRELRKWDALVGDTPPPRSTRASACCSTSERRHDAEPHPRG